MNGNIRWIMSKELRRDEWKKVWVINILFKLCFPSNFVFLMCCPRITCVKIIRLNDKWNCLICVLQKKTYTYLFSEEQFNHQSILSQQDQYQNFASIALNFDGSKCEGCCLKCCSTWVYTALYFRWHQSHVLKILRTDSPHWRMFGARISRCHTQRQH